MERDSEADEGGRREEEEEEEGERTRTKTKTNEPERENQRGLALRHALLEPAFVEGFAHRADAASRSAEGD